MTHPGPPPPDFPPFGDAPPGFMGQMPGVAMPMPPMPPMPPEPGTPLADETYPGPDEEIATGELDPRWRAAYHGLLYLGAIRGKFSYLGHSFVVRTLRNDEELLVAQIAQPWVETIGSARAHSIAMVAMCTELVDGRPLPIPIGEQQAGDIGWAEQRFLYCRRWYAMVTDHIFTRYLELEGKARELLKELGKEYAPRASGPDSSSTSGLPSDEGS